jgi:hypothetical protein
MAGGPDPSSGWGGASTAWAITGTLLAGILVWGGVGYGLDRLLGFEALLLPIGMVVGIAASIYLVYVRYGKDDGRTET